MSGVSEMLAYVFNLRIHAVLSDNGFSECHTGVLDDEFPAHDLPYVDNYDHASDSDLEEVDELNQPLSLSGLEVYVPEPRTPKRCAYLWPLHQMLI